MDYLINKLTRIGVFYDGAYFARISNYYRFHDAKKMRISITGLHDFIQSYLNELEAGSQNTSRIVDAHYYRGRFNAWEANKKPNQLLHDRAFDDALSYANVQTHYIPTTVGKNGKTFISEKGVDIWFALECFELCLLKKYDIVVLIAGDKDHLPLLRKLNSLGTRTLLVYWDLEPGEIGTIEEKLFRISHSLITEAFYHLNMAEVMKSSDQSWTDKLFITADGDDEERSSIQPFRFYQVARESESTKVREPEIDELPVSTRLLGKIHHIDYTNGHGYLHGINNIYDNLIFFRNSRNTEEFNSLEKYDLVEFELAQNTKGDYATNVRFTGKETFITN